MDPCRPSLASATPPTSPHRRASTISESQVIVSSRPSHPISARVPHLLSPPLPATPTTPEARPAGARQRCLRPSSGATHPRRSSTTSTVPLRTRWAAGCLGRHPCRRHDLCPQGLHGPLHRQLCPRIYLLIAFPSWSFGTSLCLPRSLVRPPRSGLVASSCARLCVAAMICG
jgi:hypothetical protein